MNICDRDKLSVLNGAYLEILRRTRVVWFGIANGPAEYIEVLSMLVIRQLDILISNLGTLRISCSPVSEKLDAELLAPVLRHLTHLSTGNGSAPLLITFG